MSSRQRKQKPALRDEGWSFLAQVCSDQQWQRCLDLSGVSIGALMDYVKTLASPQNFKAFEEANLPPDVLAERRKAEAEKRDAEEKAKRTIYTDGRTPRISQQRIVESVTKAKGEWKSLERVNAEETAKKLAAQKAKREHGDLVPFPEPEWE
jgi:hypothetical protein